MHYTRDKKCEKNIFKVLSNYVHKSPLKPNELTQAITNKLNNTPIRISDTILSHVSHSIIQQIKRVPARVVTLFVLVLNH